MSTEGVRTCSMREGQCDARSGRAYVTDHADKSMAAAKLLPVRGVLSRRHSRCPINPVQVAAGVDIKREEDNGDASGQKNSTCGDGGGDMMKSKQGEGARQQIPPRSVRGGARRAELTDDAVSGRVGQKASVPLIRGIDLQVPMRVRQEARLRS